MGWILRDHTEQIKWCGAKTYPHLLSALDAEASALSWATSFVTNLQCDQVIFESDSKTLIQAVQGHSVGPRLQGYIRDIKKTRGRTLQTSFRYQDRNGNMCADFMAKRAASWPIYSAFVDCNPPPWLVPLMERDLVIFGS